MLCFTLLSENKRKIYSDVLMIDSHNDNGQYNIFLFKGIDSFGHTIILYVCITPKYDQAYLFTALENYQMAGFPSPRCVILEQGIEYKEAFDKIQFKPECFQLCQNHVLSILKKTLVDPETGFSRVEVKNTLALIKKIINLPIQDELTQQFNEIYKKYRDRSTGLKKTLINLFQTKKYFAKSLVNSNYNFEKLYTSMKGDDLSIILKRTPQRNGSFIDFYNFLHLHLKKCKDHIRITRMKLTDPFIVGQKEPYISVTDRSEPIIGVIGFARAKILKQLAQLGDLEIVHSTQNQYKVKSKQGQEREVQIFIESNSLVTNCSCHYQKVNGVPCSHFIKVMSILMKDIYDYKIVAQALIDRRWIEPCWVKQHDKVNYDIINYFFEMTQGKPATYQTTTAQNKDQKQNLNTKSGVVFTNGQEA
ncbi:hypothetical protein FGO68_gene16330 [Halteria grandinella]|uniref:SWIM-type domain-containing protein n=1 Tax=Halteria grandinella TaxID=5974 RepID=A0A8J8T638_HALGN|nr:hypothetical protein FGO68_gene16330 [Halteria grandinella]